MERHSFRIVPGESRKLCGKYVFPKNFHTKKLGEITVFFAVRADETAAVRRLISYKYLYIRHSDTESYRWQVSCVLLKGIYGSSCDFTPCSKFGRGEDPTSLGIVRSKGEGF